MQSNDDRETQASPLERKIRAALSQHWAASDAFRNSISPQEQHQTSVPEWDGQFRLVRVHHEHREELCGLRFAGIGADAMAVAGQLGEVCPAV
jgi:hypothetical protein